MKNSFFTRPGWTFMGLLRNIFFLMVFIVFAPALFISIKDMVHEMLEEKESVGYIILRGMITDSAAYTKRIEDFAKNDEVKGLLIKIESPGGLPGSGQAIFNELMRFKEKKPVVVFVENICASAAYYVACGAHKIIANPSSMVGSIGVYMRIPEVADRLSDWKINTIFIQSGTYKTAGDPMRKTTPEELAYMQKLSDDCYDQFVTDVAAQRGLDAATQKEWADGKLFTGNQALNLGLVDELGAHSDALHAIKELANIAGEVRLVTAKRPGEGLWHCILGEEEFGGEMSSSLAASCGQWFATAQKAWITHMAGGATQPLM